MCDTQGRPTHSLTPTPRVDEQHGVGHLFFVMRRWRRRHCSGRVGCGLHGSGHFLEALGEHSVVRNQSVDGRRKGHFTATPRAGSDHSTATKMAEVRCIYTGVFFLLVVMKSLFLFIHEVHMHGSHKDGELRTRFSQHFFMADTEGD